MCWFKSNSKKELGIFFSSRRQAEPGAERAPGSFLIYAEEAREKVGSFFSPCLQSRTSIRNLRSGLLLYEYITASKKIKLFI